MGCSRQESHRRARRVNFREADFWPACLPWLNFRFARDPLTIGGQHQRSFQLSRCSMSALTHKIPKLIGARFRS